MKMKKYKSTCERRNLNYIPICGECTGGWTETSHKIFKEIIRASALRRNIKLSILEDHFIKDYRSIFKK